MEQITLNLQQAKQEIKEEMAKTAQSFVIIGYRLRQILDSGAYVQDGYTDFNEFALKEFGLSQSGTSRFISINKNYSEGGYGPVLREEYTGYSCSQLSEMLSLSLNDRSMVTEDMPVAQIREVKTFVRSEDRIGGQVAMDFGATVSSKALYMEMFKNHTEELRHLLEDDVDEKEVCEIMCPSGSRVFRYKTIMVIMHDISKGVVVRVFGGNQETFTYQMMLQDIRLNVSVEDIVDATSHIEKNVESTESETELEEEKNEAVEEASKEEPEKEEKEEPQSEEAAGAAGEIEGDEQETAPEEQDIEEPEKLEGEVIDSDPIMQQDAQVKQVINANTMRGYKAAMSSQIRKMGDYLDTENWRGMKKVAEDIAWRAGKILGEEN